MQTSQYDSQKKLIYIFFHFPDKEKKMFITGYIKKRKRLMGKTRVGHQYDKTIFEGKEIPQY